MDLWRGGVVRVCELRAEGLSRRDIARGVRDGTLIAIRAGWYAPPGLDEARMAAARVGGRLTCITAAQAYGLWMPPSVEERVHLAVHAASHRDPGPHRLHRSIGEPTLARCRDRTIVPPIEMIEQVIRCQDAEVAFVIVESALARRLITQLEWASLLHRLPARLAGPLLLASDLSGSGTESAFVFRMRRRGVPIVQQVRIGPDRVDVLLDDGTVVELDSREFHDALVDARRDARVGVAGHPTLRFRYEQVWFEWATVEAAVDAEQRRRAA